MIHLYLMLLLAGDAQAQTKKLDTNLYIQEAEPEKLKSFTAKVRVVREIGEEIEVFFEGDEAKGAYTLPRSSKNYAAMLSDLEKSRKPGGGAVAVTADADKRIKTVSSNKESTQPKGIWNVDSSD